MNAPSLSSGCEIAQFFVRHIDEQMMKSGFSIEFSAIRSPNRVLNLDPHLIFCSSFQNLRLGGVNV